MRLAALALIAALALELAVRVGERLSCGGGPPPEPGFDLYGVGESTAAGEPFADGAFSLASLTALRMGGRREGLPLEPTTLARGGETIVPQTRKLERALRCRDRSRPGVALFYTGHNERYDRHGDSPLTLWERHFPRSRALDLLVYALEERFPALRVRTLETWAFHLERALRACRGAGVRALVIVPVSDLRIAPPVKGADAGLSDPAYRTWRLARAAEDSGRAAEAFELYEKARDQAVPHSFGRATRPQIALLRDVAARSEATVVDPRPAFAGRGDLFMDGQHPSMEGYLLLADAAAGALGAPAAHPMTAAEAHAAFDCGDACLARASAQAGWWWLGVSVGDAAPAGRLAAARRRFRDALARDPGLYGARVGLAVAERPGLLDDEKALGVIGASGLFYGRKTDLTPESRAALASLLGREP